MKVLEEKLGLFEPIGLTELEKVSLLDRLDTKYVFSRDRLPEFLDRLKESYYVLDIDHHRMFNYESLYFDTDSFHLYNLHSHGRLNRYKVRCRKYVESGLVYFEIKFKNNKGRTIKSRVKMQSEHEIGEEALKLLQDKTPFSMDDLKAIIWVNYIRITLVSKDFKERLTIDVDLSFKHDHEEQKINNLVIAELKQDKSHRSAFSQLMKEFHIRKGSLSKYCFGIASLFKNVKANNFKYQFLNLNKILNAATSS